MTKRKKIIGKKMTLLEDGKIIKKTMQSKNSLNQMKMILKIIR